MNDLDEQKPADEAIAAKRYFLMGVARLVALAAVLAGLAMSRAVIPGPYELGVALAFGGLIAFFFGPVLLAKRWKAGDRGELGRGK